MVNLSEKFTRAIHGEGWSIVKPCPWIAVVMAGDVKVGKIALNRYDAWEQCGTMSADEDMTKKFTNICINNDIWPTQEWVNI